MRNAKLHLENYFLFFLKLTFLGGIGALTLPGCATSRDAMCKELPISNTEIASFKAELDSRFIGRHIASATQKKVVDASPDGAEVALWMNWAERVLKRTQWARDALEDDRSGTKAVPYLNEAGLSLVSLHGFLEQKKWHKAYMQLEKIEANLEKASALTCFSTNKVDADRQPSSDPSPKKKKTAHR